MLNLVLCFQPGELAMEILVDLMLFWVALLRLHVLHSLVVMVGMIGMVPLILQRRRRRRNQHHRLRRRRMVALPGAVVIVAVELATIVLVRVAGLPLAHHGHIGRATRTATMAIAAGIALANVSIRALQVPGHTTGGSTSDAVRLFAAAVQAPLILELDPRASRKAETLELLRLVV